jgi:arylsulfatase A-like enzyme
MIFFKQAFRLLSYYLSLKQDDALPTKMALIVSHGWGFDDLEYITESGRESQIMRYLPRTIEDFTAPAADTNFSYNGMLTGTLQLNSSIPQHLNTPNLHSVFTSNGIMTHHAGLWSYANFPYTNSYTITYDPNEVVNSTLKFINDNDNYFVTIFMPKVDISYIPNATIYSNTKCIGKLPQNQTMCGGQIYSSSIIYEDSLLGQLFAELNKQKAYVIWTTAHGGVDPHTHVNSEPRTSLRGAQYSLYDGGIRTRLRYNPGAYDHLMRNDGNGIDFLTSLPSLAGITTPSTDGINLFNKSAIRVKDLEWATFQRAEGNCLKTSPGRAKQITQNGKQYKSLWDGNRTEIYHWNEVTYSSGYEFVQAEIDATLSNRPNYTLASCREIIPVNIVRSTKPKATIKYVITLMADDMGWGDYSFRSQHPTNNNYPNTPNIDMLANEGVILNRYYVSSICSPSRASFHAGRFHLHEDVGIHSVYSDLFYVPTYYGVTKYLGFEKNITVLAQTLEKNDIATGQFGKSHVANLGTQTLNYYGVQNYKCYECTVPPSNKSLKYDQFLWNFPGTSSELIVNDSLVWMNEQLAKNKPFYINIWFKSSHVQVNALPGQVQAMGYGNQQNPSLLPGVSKFSQASAWQTYNGLVHEHDLQVGRIREWIDQNKITDSTVIIYLTDNGPERQTAEDNSVGDSGFRGCKRSLYEGGIKVPAIFWAPGLGIQGETNTLASVTDWYPTILGLYGFDITQQAHDYKRLDGKNLLPCLLNNDCATTDNRTLITEARVQMGTGDCTDVSPRFAIIKTPYKLLLDSGEPLPPSKIVKFSRTELYDLTKDPIEFQNIASQYPQVVAELTESLKSYPYYDDAHWIRGMGPHEGEPQDKRLRVGFRCNG